MGRAECASILMNEALENSVKTLQDCFAISLAAVTFHRRKLRLNQTSTDQ